MDRGRLGKGGRDDHGNIRPVQVQDDHSRPVGGGSGGVGPLESTLDAWLGPVTDRMLDLRRPRRRQQRYSTSRRAPAGRALAAARRVGPDGRVLGHRHLAGDPRVRRPPGRRRRHGQRRRPGMDGEHLVSSTGRFDAVISRLGTDLLPGPRGRPRRYARRVCGRAAGSARSCTARPTSTASSRCPSASSGGAPNCRRPRPASLGRSRLGGRGVLEPAYSRRPDSATSPSSRSTRRCGCHRPPTVCDSSRSRSAHCTRCWSPSMTLPGPRHGRRSAPRSPDTTVPAGSPDPVRCWSPPQPNSCHSSTTGADAWRRSLSGRNGRPHVRAGCERRSY